MRAGKRRNNESVSLHFACTNVKQRSLSLDFSTAQQNQSPFASTVFNPAAFDREERANVPVTPGVFWGNM
jgi:hypothetical protein